MLGLSRRKFQEGGYKDPDVLRYREVFLPVLNEIQAVFVSWDKEGKMIMPQNLPTG